MAREWDDISLTELHARRSAKWTRYPADVLPLWVAEMDFPLADPVADTLRDMVDRGDTGYAAPWAPDLAEAFAKFADAAWGQQVDPDAVRLMPDVLTGIGVALELASRPGDGVVIDTPVYPPFLEAIERAGRRGVEVDAVLEGDRWVPDLAGAAAAYADGARVHLLCNPHNPLGTVLRRAELEAVAEQAGRRGVTVVADEVHAPLSYDTAHVPFATIDADAARSSYTLTSASKAWNVAGLKAALLLAGPAVAKRLDDVPEVVSFGASLLGVAAGTAAFGEGRPWLDGTLAYLDGNRRALADLLAEHLPAVRYRVPEATYLAWLDCRALGLGDDPATAFLERGRVAVSGGLDFGARGAGHVRLNFATSRPLLAEAVRRMASAV